MSIIGLKAEALWEAYRTNFEPLAELAVLQHYFSRDEVLAELANFRIIKIVGWQVNTPVGLAMVTNSLEDVPQISPAFLRSKYPAHAARAGGAETLVELADHDRFGGVVEDLEVGSGRAQCADGERRRVHAVQCGE